MNQALLIALIACSCAAPAKDEPQAPLPIHTASTAEHEPTRMARTAEREENERACVVNPFEHGVRYLVEHHGEEIAELTGRSPEVSDYPAPGSNCVDVVSLPDLDGDGEGEVEVTEGCSWGTYAQLHLLYFSARGCSRFAGEIIHAELTPLETQSEGVRDLEATWSNGCAGNDFRWTRFQWRDGAYHVADEAVCQLCSEATAAAAPQNTHRHCQEEAKRRRQ